LIFCDYPGEVEATNNGSERKLRPCVIQRKVTNGYRAMWAAEPPRDCRRPQLLRGWGYGHEEDDEQIFG
jgi:hypothetical protein